MTWRINPYRCVHCGCDEPILGIDNKLYCDNCGMCLESTLPSHAQASKLEGGLMMALEEWISRFDNEEADKLTQDEQLEIKSMLIELRWRRDEMNDFTETMKDRAEAWLEAYNNQEG